MEGRGGLNELDVVMPVYDEEAVVGEVLRAWIAELDRLAIDFRILAYDDGSRDGTWEVLERTADEEPRLVAVRQANRGHGPTVLRGYREASAEWVFQVDSDGEMPCAGFDELWRRRHGYDLLLGWRRNRRGPAGRRLVTAVARTAVRRLFGGDVRDVNVPFRLIRREVLARLLDDVPASAFAPNVLLSGLAARDGLPIYQTAVDDRERPAGSGSLGALRLARGAARSFAELAAVALRTRGRR